MDHFLPALFGLVLAGSSLTGCDVISASRITSGLGHEIRIDYSRAGHFRRSVFLKPGEAMTPPPLSTLRVFSRGELLYERRAPCGWGWPCSQPPYVVTSTGLFEQREVSDERLRRDDVIRRFRERLRAGDADRD